MLKTPLTLIVGLIIGAVVGPMISGAIGSAFWSHAADGNDPQKVASRLYTRAQGPLPAHAFQHDTRSPCRAELQKYVFSKAAPAGAIEVTWYLDRARDAIVSAKYGDLALQSLEGLPSPILGALDGCVSGSPVSSFCLKYIADRTEKAVRVPRETQQAWNVMADREMTASWCAAKTMSFPESNAKPTAS